MLKGAGIFFAVLFVIEWNFNGDPGVIRTPGLRLRRQSLYPLSYGAFEVFNRANIATLPNFVKPSALTPNHIHQPQKPTLLELNRLHRAHLMTAITPNAFPVIEVQPPVFVP